MTMKQPPYCAYASTHRFPLSQWADIRMQNKYSRAPISDKAHENRSSTYSGTFAVFHTLPAIKLNSHPEMRIPATKRAYTFSNDAYSN